MTDGRTTTKFLATAVLVLLVSLVVCFALYVWQQSQPPKRRCAAAIERRFGKQLKRLADYAADYEHIFDGERWDSEKNRRLFADPAIMEAAVYGFNSNGNKGGTAIKPPTSGAVLGVGERAGSAETRCRTGSPSSTIGKAAAAKLSSIALLVGPEGSCAVLHDVGYLRRT